MTTAPPTLREWHRLKPPEIRLLQSLGSAILWPTYNNVYWIAKEVDNVVVEYYALADWYFTDDGRLIGTVNTESFTGAVEIKPNEYLILSLT